MFGARVPAELRNWAKLRALKGNVTVREVLSAALEAYLEDDHRPS